MAAHLSPISASQDQIDQFTKAYGCRLAPSRQQYRTPVFNPLAFDQDPGAKITDIAYYSEPGIDVTMMRSSFDQLIADAEEGREQRQTRNYHPAVREAWEQYQVLLELARRSPR